MTQTNLVGYPMLTLVKKIEGEYDEIWDDFAQTYIYAVNGSLADDVRRTWGLESSEPVILVEDVAPGGYYDTTREDDYDFTIKAGGLVANFETIKKCEDYFAS